MLDPQSTDPPPPPDVARAIDHLLAVRFAAWMAGSQAAGLAALEAVVAAPDVTAQLAAVVRIFDGRRRKRAGSNLDDVLRSDRRPSSIWIIRAVTDEGERWGTGDLEFVGTAAYTDPQHVTEGITSPQSDVFSVCVVLYEMIAGRYLFDETTMRHRPIVAEEFAPELAPLVAELQRGTAPTYERHASMEDLVRRLEIVRSSLAATQPARTTRPPWRWLLAGAAAVAVAFLSGLAVARLMDTRTDAALSTHPPNAPVEKNMPVKTYADQPDAATPPDDAPAAAESVAATRPPNELAPASAGAPSPEKTAPTRPPKPAPATTWDARMRKAEASARRCLDAAGVEPRPLVVTILPDAPAQVRRVGSDSTHARFIRDALDRHELRVDQDSRQHTFFAEPAP